MKTLKLLVFSKDNFFEKQIGLKMIIYKLSHLIVNDQLTYHFLLTDFPHLSLWKLQSCYGKYKMYVYK